MVDPAAPHITTKRAMLQGLCMEGRITMLQETHWDDTSAAMWAGLCPGCKVLASPARPGPHGGPQGGVAILLPPTWRCLEIKKLVPGCVLQARIRAAASGTEVLVQSVYLPPTRERQR